MTKHLNIMGTRGVPAGHGGYEYFAAALASYLVSQGWTVNVYCQDDDGVDGFEDDWNGVRRIHFVPRSKGTLGTMEFDAKCVLDVLKRPGVDLVLGYNTAVFNMVQRLFGRKVAMNMDGIEWKRGKWSIPAKIWFYCNELAGANLANLPISDHPEMEKHLRPRTLRKIVMIPYGAEAVTSAPIAPLAQFGLQPGKYFIKIARTVPENSILEIIRAYSREERGAKLVVLGNFSDANEYHIACRAAASGEVLFPGAIFDQSLVHPLRYHARAYFHGHTVGGTNPSLCEALGAGNAIIAHRNRFNCWVAGPGQLYFENEDDCDVAIRVLLSSDERVEKARAAARIRHAEAFTWPKILEAYEGVLEKLLD